MDKTINLFRNLRVNRRLQNVDLNVYWILSSVTNFKCRRRSPIQELRLVFSTLMSSVEFIITIITKSIFPMCPHLSFRQMLDRSGSRSQRDWISLGNHISEWNKSGSGALLSPTCPPPTYPTLGFPSLCWDRTL